MLPTRRRAKKKEACVFRLSAHAHEQPLGVTHSLRESRKRVVLVFLVLEADQIWILNLEQRFEDGFQIENDAASLDGSRFRICAGDVLHMKVVEPRAAFPNRFSRIDFRASRVPNVNAQTDALVVWLNCFPYIVRRWESFVLRSVIVNGKLDVEFFYHLIENRHRVGMRTAYDGWKPDVSRVLKRLTNIRFVILHGHVAATHRRNPSVFELLGDGLPLFRRAFQRQVSVFDRNVFQSHALYGLDRGVERHLPQSVRGDSCLETAPRVVVRPNDSESRRS